MAALDKSGSSSTTAAQAHHNTVWANVYGIKTTGDETGLSCGNEKPHGWLYYWCAYSHE